VDLVGVELVYSTSSTYLRGVELECSIVGLPGLELKCSTVGIELECSIVALPGVELECSIVGLPGIELECSTVGIELECSTDVAIQSQLTTRCSSMLWYWSPFSERQD